MKKIIFLIFFITTTAFSQITDENGINSIGDSDMALSGNIGIGVTPLSTSPYKLEVSGNVKAKQGWFINTLPNGYVFTGDWAPETALIRAGVNTAGGGLLNFYDIPQSNYHDYPRVRFSIIDRDDTNRLRFFADQGGPTAFNLYDKNQNSLFEFWDNGNDVTAINFRKDKSYVVIGGPGVWPNNHKLTVRDGNALVEGDIFSTGNIGIGTMDTKGFKLGVQGKIAAEEVKVAIYDNWSDFVFDKNYNLPTLSEVEQYIEDNGHLKDIPSAEDVKENGVFLGDINAKLLQKIEELTLYTIEQEKKIEVLNQLKAENECLNKRVETLEALMLKLVEKQ